MNGKKFTGLFVLVLLAALPGCDWFGSHDSHNGSCCGGHGVEQSAGSGQVLLSLKGNPILYSSDLENYIDQIMEESPQVKAILDAMPDAKYNIFSGMVAEELLLQWARENGIYELDSYKKDYALALKMLDRQIIQKYFQENLMKKVSVSESDAKKYYDANKNNIPDFVVTPASEKDGKKQEAVYRAFSEVKDAIVKMLENEKASEMYTKELEELKKEFNAEENSTYFKKDAESVQMPDMETMANMGMMDASEEADANSQSATADVA